MNSLFQCLYILDIWSADKPRKGNKITKIRGSVIQEAMQSWPVFYLPPFVSSANKLSCQMHLGKARRATRVSLFFNLISHLHRKRSLFLVEITTEIALVLRPPDK